MAKKLIAVLAGAIEGKRKAIPLIVASCEDSPITRKYTVLSHECPHCKTTATVNNVSDAACPSCAQTMQPIAKANTREVSIEKGFTRICNCTACDAVLNVESSALDSISKDIDGKTFSIHCTVCGVKNVVQASMSEKPEDEDMESTDDDSEELVDEFEEAEEASDDSDYSGDEDEEDKSEDEDFSDDSSDEPETDEDNSSDDADSFDDEPEDSEGEEGETEDEDDASGSEIVEEDDEDKSEDETSEADDDDVNPADNDEGKTKIETVPEDKKEEPSVAVSAVHAANLANSELELISSTLESGNVRWHLFADGKHVAAANIENADKTVVSIFNNVNRFREVFSETVLSSETHKEIDEALNKLGFESDKIVVPVDKATAQFIQAKVEEATANFVASSSEIEDRFKKCLSVAALGVRKGSFGVDSPLAEKLTALLIENRVRGAERIVAQAFEESSEAELKLIVSKTVELVGKGDQHISAIASVVETSPFKKPETVDEKETVARVIIPQNDDRAKIEAPVNTKSHHISAADIAHRLRK